MRNLVALAASLVLVFGLSARPANAQSIVTPPVVPDRTAVVLTYQPVVGAGAAAASNFTAAVSYQFGPTWDLLVSNTSGPSGPTGGFRFGGRYHVRSPSPTLDVYLTAIYTSPGSPSGTFFGVGAGVTQTVAPGLKSYAALTYQFLPTGASAIPGFPQPIIVGNIGMQFELNRQFSMIAGYETVNGLGYLGLNFDFAVR